MTSYDNPVSAPGQEPRGPAGEPPSRRRNRWLAAAISAAAVIAITLPFALGHGRLFGGGGEPSTGVATTPAATTASTTTSPSRPASTSVATSPATTAPAAPAVLDVTHLSTGAAPAIPYARRGVVHLADGTTVMPATTHHVVGFTELADGTLAFLTDHDSSFAVEITTTDGTHLGPYPSGYEIVINAERTLVAWLSRTGTPIAWQPGLSAPVSLPSAIPGSSRRAAAVTGTSVTQCTVYASSWQRQGSHAWSVTSAGLLTPADGSARLIWVSDVSEDGRLVGYTSITDTGSRSAVIDPSATGKTVLWSTSRHTLDRFSPTGEFLLAGPAYRDGIGDGRIAVYTDTGKLLVDRQTSDRHPGFYQGATWEDATHVLFPIFQAERWSLVRMSVTGAMEYAVPPVAGSMDHNPFVVATVP